MKRFVGCEIIGNDSVVKLAKWMEEKSDDGWQAVQTSFFDQNGKTVAACIMENTRGVNPANDPRF